MYWIGQKWCCLLQKVIKLRYGFPWMTYMWSGLIGQWPSQKFAKICQALRLTCKVSSFHLHVKFTCFNFLTQISWILFFQTLNHNQGRVITPAFPKSWKLWTISSLMNRFPKSPCKYVGPLYFDICTPVFVMRTLDSTYIKLEYIKWGTYLYRILSTYID
jgi:hypothetical protein